MKPDAYARNIAARAFDVARYLLFWGVPTNVGQVTSIRTLEKQIKRLRASEFAEVRELGEEVAAGLRRRRRIASGTTENNEPLAPTLARHAEPDEYCAAVARRSEAVGDAEPDRRRRRPIPDVDLIKPDDVLTEIAATLLYPVCDHPFRAIYETVRGWSNERRGRSSRCRGQIARPPRRSAARIPRRPVLLRHADRYRRLSRHASASPLPSVPAGVFTASTDIERRHCSPQPGAEEIYRRRHGSGAR